MVYMFNKYIYIFNMIDVASNNYFFTFLMKSFHHLNHFTHLFRYNCL
jgi:hypothetical protein